MTPPVYVIDVRAIALAHAAHSVTSEHADAVRWAQTARLRLDAAEARWAADEPTVPVARAA